MKSAELEEVSAGGDATSGGSSVSKFFKPEGGSGAQMIEGSAADQAAKIVEILNQKGIK